MPTKDELIEKHARLTAELENIEKILSIPDPENINKDVEVIRIKARKEPFKVVDVWYEYPDKPNEYIVIGKYSSTSEIWVPIKQFIEDNFNKQIQKQVIVDLLDNTNGS